MKTAETPRKGECNGPFRLIISITVISIEISFLSIRVLATFSSLSFFQS